MTNELTEAIAEEDVPAIARLLGERDFTLIEFEEDSDEEGRAALTVEVDDHPVLIAFFTDEHAGAFVSAMPELFDNAKEVSGFVVSGCDVLSYLPDGFGMLLNPETDDAYEISAELCARLLRFVENAPPTA